MLYLPGSAQVMCFSLVRVWNSADDRVCIIMAMGTIRVHLFGMLGVTIRLQFIE